MSQYKGYFFDIDGTIIRGEEAIDGAREFLHMLQANHLPFLYLTNNSSRKPQQLISMLRDFHFPVQLENIYTTSMAITRYLTEHWRGASVYVIGEDGLIEGVKKAGCVLKEQNPDVVVVGRDRGFNYEKLSTACYAVANGATLIGTSRDRAYPVDDRFLPGSGALVKAIETATRINAFYIGKPEQTIMQYALEYTGLEAEDVVMVGDNLETDIMVSQTMSMDTWLVLSGVTNERMAKESSLQPTYQTNSIQDGVQLFKNGIL
ncbi:4-nitrophenyl phosphatase [Seinonella peptonophila]|uniref:Acid sugar phosphatase n=1 Tax=Seinonella peptonophila TaxID=112248 RepID=A0A1M4WKG2_9BACL|nr:TIGR01457 family HAD-type hydrolase [Seinonella peptonophila]SHE81695.1 4-nitrophenyl phosphatase [Seinonella peptonophila]